MPNARYTVFNRSASFRFPFTTKVFCFKYTQFLFSSASIVFAFVATSMDAVVIEKENESCAREFMMHII